MFASGAVEHEQLVQLSGDVRTVKFIGWLDSPDGTKRIQFTFPQERPFRRRRRRPPKTRPLRAGKEWQVNPPKSHSEDKSSLALAAATHASLSLSSAQMILQASFPPGQSTPPSEMSCQV